MLTLTQLLQIPNVDTGLRFAISPDESQVVFSWNKSGMWELYSSSLQGGRSSRRSNLNEKAEIASGGVLIREGRYSTTTVHTITEMSGAKFSPRFSPDGTHLAYALDMDGSESYHIILHNLQDDSHIDLTPFSGYALQPNFDFSPDGKTLAVLSDEAGQFALYLLDIETREKKLLLDVHRPIWDVAWSPDGRCIAVEAEWKASDGTIYVVEVESGKWNQLQVNDVTLNAQHPSWSPDSKSLAFSCDTKHGEWHNIGLYDVETKEVTWLTDSIGDDTQPCWSRSGNVIGWVHAEGAKTGFQFKKGSDATKQVKVGEGVHAFPQVTGNSVVILYEDANHPADLWLIDLEDGSKIQLTHSSGEMNFAVPEEIFIGNVPALLYRGNGKRAVIDIHGGPNWNLQFSWNPALSYMAAQGWTVLAPNYRGSTGYGKMWQNASVFDMGGVDAQDCAACAKWLLENGIKKVAVTGRSHGGFLTMCCLTMYPELFAGGSAVVPFLNWFKSHFNSREDLQHWNIENMGDPEDNKELWHARSPYFFLDQVTAPVQLICGENDPRCPASDSIDAHDKLLELGKEVELLLYKGEGHVFLNIENVIDAEMKRLDFLKRILED
ncbi:MAG: S9 family peptidase [Chloroflexi bacterium]|nr:S9 family peptidase [Chloroflexota bacterium]